MSDIITFIGYRQCIFMSGLSLCAECTFFSCIFTVQILLVLLHFTESIVMSDIITFRVLTVDIYIWSIIVRIVHICSCIISIPILGVITLYRVCSYLLILLLPLWGTDSVHLGMVFFVYGVHIHLNLLLQYTGPIYIYIYIYIYICLVLLQLWESTVSGIITCIDTDGIWKPLNRSSFIWSSHSSPSSIQSSSISV